MNLRCLLLILCFIHCSIAEIRIPFFSKGTRLNSTKLYTQLVLGLPQQTTITRLHLNDRSENPQLLDKNSCYRGFNSEFSTNFTKNDSFPGGFYGTDVINFETESFKVPIKVLTKCCNADNSLMSLRPSLGVNDFSFVADYVLKQSEQTAILYFDQIGDTGLSSTNGTLILAGKADDLCSTFEECTLTHSINNLNNTWAVEVKQMTSNSLTEPIIAKLSIEDYNTYIPDPYYSNLISQLEISADEYVECNFENNKEITFNINGMNLTLRPQDYLDVSSFGTHGKCTSRIKRRDYMQLPVTIFKHHCLLLNYKTNQVGLAEKKLVSPTDQTNSPQTSTNSNNSTNPFVLGLEIFGPFTIFIICVSVGIFIWYRWRMNRWRKQKVHLLASNALKVIGISLKKKSFDPWQISFKNVSIDHETKLGSGAFSDVYVGKLSGDAAIKQIYPDMFAWSKFRNCKVAVKMLPPFSNDSAKENFQREINIMKRIKSHPNVLTLLGYVSDSMLILEYCDRDLLCFLHEYRKEIAHSCDEIPFILDLKRLLSFAWQVASGCKFLSGVGLIHRDIAARNVLLTNNNTICKIGDFGMCRRMSDQIYLSRGGKLPIRWLSIESLKSFEFSVKSDVWSYGIMLYEIFSLGENPYEDLDNTDILKFLSSDNRLGQPDFCPDRIYNLMRNCWLLNPNDRPDFSDICLWLSESIETASTNYNYVDTSKQVHIETDSLEEEVYV